MPKSSTEQRIAKVEEAIAKEELAIEASRNKIKELNAELKTLRSEQEQQFANEVLKLMKSKGISQADLMKELLAKSGTSSATEESSSDIETSSSTVTNATANNSQFGNRPN